MIIIQLINFLKLAVLSSILRVSKYLNTLDISLKMLDKVNVTVPSETDT